MLRNCSTCDKEFDARNTVHHYCSRSCKDRRHREPTYTAVHTCPVCNVDFETHNPNTVYCGGKCGAIATRLPTTVIECKTCGSEVLYKHRYHNSYCSAKCYELGRVRVRLWCSDMFVGGTNKKYCTPFCQHRHKYVTTHSDKHNTVRRCATCDKEFVSFWKRKHCSRECSSKSAHDKRRGLNLELIYLFLCDRDGSTCHICSKPIDMTLRGYRPDAPCVDHVVPLSKGGANTPGNVKLAHMGCNSMKGVRSVEYTQKWLKADGEP